MDIVRVLGSLTRGDQVRNSKAIKGFNGIEEDVPSQPVLKPMADGSGFSGKQANALKVLTFAGKGFTLSPGLQIEHEFIRSLGQQSENVEEKAGLVEMLGRARSINALPHLLPLLDGKEDVEVRIATVKALARIGSGTDTNGYTRTHLAEALIEAYEQRKAELSKRLLKAPAKTYAGRQEESEARERLLEELKAMAVAISELNVTQGRRMLQADYRKSLVITEQASAITQEMQRAIQIAEEELHRKLQKQYKKSVKELLSEMHPDELQKLQGDIKVNLPDGQSLSLLEAKVNIHLLQGQQLLASNLLLGIMEGLSKHRDEEFNASLKLGLASSNPMVKAKSLQILAERNGVSYNSDVYPNLNSTDGNVRRAALQALLASPEQAAKQKTIELLMPKAFFDVLGGRLTQDSLTEYVGFLSQIAEHGDEYIQALGKRALNTDYDIETRQVALLVLNMMTHEPAVGKVTPGTAKQAQTVIKMLASNAPARNPEERDALTVTATKLWVDQKDPQAIPSAILLANSRMHRMTVKDREQLLGGVLRVLQKDADRQAGGMAQLKHRVLDVLKNAGNPLLPAEAEQAISKSIGPDALQELVAPKDMQTFTANNRNLKLNTSLIAALKPAIEPMRPYLSELLDDEQSTTTQMIASRIIGLLKDKVLIDPLVAKVRDPLKGAIDWNANRSYRGNPSQDGANIRLNALVALGNIGDAKALDVMLDAMDDPILREHVVGPLGKLAKDVNAKADAATLAKVHRKLVKLMEDPDTTRAQRAARISAANALFEFKGGPEAIKAFVVKTNNPNFKRHALSALLSHNYATEPSHPDHALVKHLIQPELGVERLHAKGITGKGVDMGIIDGGYVDATNSEAFQKRVKLPASARSPEHYHPTMVMSTAAANGKLKGVAPDAVVYSDKWPEFDGPDPMEVYKKIIEGKLRGENNVRVINNSWGFSNQNVLIFKEIRTILKEFKKVVDLAEKAGIQIVFAAGNEGEQVGIPKIGTLSLFGLDVDKLTADDQKTLDYILDKIILVGASNTEGTENRKHHKIAEFSSVGDSLNTKLIPTVVAPGVDMMVYGWGEDGSQPKELVNGTSFASPYVSGLIALMVQANPKITPAQIRDVLKKTAIKLDDVPRTLQGHGQVDPEAAVTLAKNVSKKSRVRKPAAPPQTPPQAPPAESKPSAPAADAQPPAKPPAGENPQDPPKDGDQPAA